MSETSDQKPRKPKSRRYGLWMASVYLVFVFGGLYLLGSGLNHFLVSNFGGGTAGLPQDVYLSQGIQMYELRFRTSAKDVTPLEAKSLPRKEWILNIPRAYVVNLIGENGAYGPDERNFATLEADIDADDKILVPSTYTDKFKSDDRTLYIGIENSGGYPQVAKVEKCIRYDDFSEFLSQFNKKERDGKCGSSSRKCLTYAQLNGWHVEISMPRSFYFSDPQPVCSAVKAFLNKYTTSRDKLR